MTKTTVVLGGVKNEDGTRTGGMEVTLCTSAYLPILYRIIHHEDFLRQMNKLERIRAKWMREESVRKLVSAARRKQNAPEDDTDGTETADEATPDTAETVEETAPEDEAAAGDTDTDEEDAATFEMLLEQMDLVFIARMEYTMARMADPSIPDSMEEWFSSLPTATAVYDLLAPALSIYGEDGKTTSVAKKNSRRRKGK